MTWITPLVSKTAYDLTGPSGAPVVVFIHGLGLSRRLWDAHLLGFAGYRVLNYDLFGHGESGPLPKTASLGIYARQLADLMDSLDITQAHIVGFSIGGMINRRFALDFPEMVTSLVILNSPHDRGAQGQKAVETRATAAKDQGAFATFDAALQRWFTPDFLAAGHGADQVRRWREVADPEGYAQASWVLANGVRELIAPTPAITAPTLVMTCENDSGSTPAMSHDIAAEISGADTIIIPHLQHLGLMERPTDFTVPILKFIASNAQ